jgi:hypothetical protein
LLGAFSIILSGRMVMKSVLACSTLITKPKKERLKIVLSTIEI